MLAVHLEKGLVTTREVPRPARAEGFATLRLLMGGICNTDLELQRGYYGFAGTPGHEFVAEVVEADTPSLIGQHVAGEINLACGQCSWCARGLGRHCPNRTVLGIVRHPGAFEEFFTLPERNLHVLPADLPLERAVFLEPLAAASEILEQVAIPKGAQVAVLGDGKLGLLIGMLLQAQGLSVQQFGRHQTKLAIAARTGVTAEISGANLPVAAYDCAAAWPSFSRSARCFASTSRPREMESSSALAAPASTERASTSFSSATTVSICGSP